MTLFLFKRTLLLIVTLCVTSVVVFAVLEVLPGNAAQMLMGADASPEAVAALEKKLGLDLPATSRYLAWIAALLQGDMGESYAYSTPVWDLMAERLAVTLPLAFMAMSLTAILAIAAGVYAASRHNKVGDVGVMGLSQLGIAIPNFWFAILLILFFSVYLQWFNAGGFPGWSTDDDGGFWPALGALTLPAVSLAAVQAAILARFTRSSVIDVMREDFVRTARAKGASPRRALWGHALRNAMIPVITIMGLQFANLLAGTIVVENVFYLPGLGRLIFQSISNRDVIVVRNCVMLLATMVVVVNFVVDVLYAVIDPRIKASSL
jgi:peptide/nickel transport system permease protein